MPTELWILGVLAVLAATMWLPFIIGVNSAASDTIPPNGPDGFTLPGDFRLQRPWVQRAYRAHLNLLEQAIPFAILVLLVDRVDGLSTLTLWACAAFLLLRIAHAVGYITGWAGFPARLIIFTGGWVCCVLMAVALFAA